MTEADNGGARRREPTGRGGRVLRFLAALLTFVFLMAAGGWYALGHSGGYTATAVVAISPRDPSMASGDILTLAAQKYSAYVPAPGALQSASAQSGLGVADLQSNTTSMVESQTANIDIQVKATSALAASRAAQALGDAVVKRATGDPVVSADMIRPASVGSATAGLPLPVLLVLAALAGLIGAAIVWALFPVAATRHYDRETAE